MVDIVDDYSSDTSGKYIVFSGGITRSVVGEKLRVANGSSFGCLTTPMTATQAMSVNMALVQDSLGINHAGIWLSSSDEKYWIRYAFDAQKTTTVTVKNETPRAISAFHDVGEKVISQSFGDGADRKISAILDNEVLKLYLDDELHFERPWPYDSAKIHYFVYGCTVDYDNLTTTVDEPSVSYIGPSKYLNIYTADESGSITGAVQEKGLPIRAEVALHDRLTRKTVAIAWSDSGGNYSFSGLDKNREYYAEALHPTRKFNLVGQDGLRSGMTT